jgi:glutamate mutase epsilon subunit
MHNTTEKDLNQIANDKRAQELLAKAVQKKVEFWDALRDLEHHVGLEFDTSVPAFKAMTVFEADTENKCLKESLRRGFQDAAVVSEASVVFGEGDE